MKGFIIKKYKQQTKQQPVPSLKSVERQKPSKLPAQPRAAMWEHLSCCTSHSGIWNLAVLLGLTQPCEDYMHHSKKKKGRKPPEVPAKAEPGTGDTQRVLSDEIS